MPRPAKKKPATKKVAKKAKRRPGRQVRRGRRPELHGTICIDREAYDEMRLYCKEFAPYANDRHPLYANVVGKLLGQIPVILNDNAIFGLRRGASGSVLAKAVTTPAIVSGVIDQPQPELPIEAPVDPQPMTGEQSELAPVNLEVES